MSETTLARGQADWRPLPVDGTSQIVVATAHERLVADRIHREFAITPTRADASPELDLVLLDLDLAALRAPEGIDPLDVLFDALYAGFSTDLHWVPTFGKNRWLASVVPQNKTDPGAAPLNKTDPGDDGAPRAVDPADVEWPARTPSPGAGVRVAVADTGVAERPQFWGRVVADESSLLPARVQDAPAQAGHGSFVTGLVLKRAPGATVLARKVLDAPAATDSWQVAKDLVRLAGDRVDILNLSLGCHTSDDQPPLVFARALARLGPDVLVVAAAGNFAQDHPRKAVWPAAFEEVLAVGATDGNGTRPDWSPDPEKAPWVDVQAVGDKVTSIYLEGTVASAFDQRGTVTARRPFQGFGEWSGTSFAAARVSGMIAAGTEPRHVGPREALKNLIDKAEVHDSRPWLG